MTSKDTRPVLFFDIDNTLYSKSTKIQDMMGELINKYFREHLSISEADAFELHQRYYKDYGLAIEGLVRHHKVEPLVYNSKVDDALPLEDVLKPDADLRKLLEDIDLSKVRLWLFTNAYITHGKRVVKLLGLDDLFEGITYCDYAASRFICKPSTEMFERAQRDAGITSAEKSFIIEDSAMNCRAADALGWTTVHLVEPADALPEKPAARYVIRSLQELRTVFPQFFIS